MNAYTATSSVSGKTYTRKTAKTYTHAVIFTYPEGHDVTFCGSADLAHKAANKIHGNPRWADAAMRERRAAWAATCNVEIVELTN